MNSASEIYHNWFIGTIPVENCWKFRCRASSGKVCSYEKAYGYSEAAIIAAREFVDRDITKVLLSRVLEEWLQTDLIHEEEY